MSKYSHDHDVPFEAFITNLGKYNEGDLVGEWVKFPTTAENLEAVFKRIGIGSVDEFGQPYEEWFITDYDMYVDGMYNILGEYENLDELNYLASKIEDMNDYEYEQFCAIIDQGDYTSSVKDLINMTENLDSFEILTDVENDYDLGYYYIEEAGIYDMSGMGNLASYIDYERFGRDVALEEGGVFTDHGYVCERDSITEVYQGLEDIPEEYKLMLKEKLSAFDNISCRETFNTKMLSDLLNRNVSHVLDPTLLLSAEDWNKVATEPPVKGDYILAYILGEKDSVTEFAHSLGQQKRLPVYFIVTQPKYLSYSNALTGIGPDAFIGLVKNARFVVTDSYHGCLFCIIFGTQFFAFSKREGSVDTQDNIRILEILQVLGLEDRFWDDTRQTPLHDCNFQQAHEKIADKRQTSLKYLSGCLQ